MVDVRTLPADLVKIEDFSLPLSYEGVTPDLLTRLLQGAAPGVVVESLAISNVTEGTGSRARLTLDYNSAGFNTGLPRTMWLKSWFNELRSRHLTAGSIIGEIVYYRFAERLPVRNVGAYYSGIDASGQGLVLMGDMHALKGQFLDADTPLDLQQVRDALDQLARLHGAYWGLESPAPGALWPELANGGRLGDLIRNETIARLAQTMRQPHLEGKIPPELLVEGVYKNAMTRLLDLTSEGPHCLIHFDPHLTNLALDAEGRLMLMDWQFFRMGSWSHDVSYLIGGSLTPENRRAWERDLIKYYLDQLAAHGGCPPSFDDAWMRHAAGQAYGACAWINTRLAMQTTHTIYTMLSRHLEAMRDLGTLELLS
jgi:hypothetical protein